MKTSKSQNSIVLTGRLTADATTNESRSFARFDIAHGQGYKATKNEDGKKVLVENPTLFMKCVMFNKAGKTEVEIPLDILAKGQGVVVSGFLRPSEWTDKDGRKHRDIELVARSVEPISAEEVDEAEADDEE